MNKTQLMTSLLTAAMLVLGQATVVSAATYENNCQPLYGGYSNNCVPVNISVNKTVQDPKSKVYVDNLGNNDTKYSPDQTVNFKIVVTNTGNDTLNDVTVQDALPQYLTFTGKNGTYDTNSRTATFTIGTLKADESRTIDVQTKVVAANALPNDQGITCVVNRAVAVSHDLTSEDNAQLCIQKTVLGTTKGGNVVYPVPSAKTTPPTGPEALTLIGLLPTALAGFMLRKKNS